MSQISNIEITANGMVFDGFVCGDRNDQPIVFLHGFPQSSICWTEIMEKLADNKCFCIAFNQRGYSSGARPKDTKQYSIEYLVQDVIAVADYLGFDKFHLVGHDWGGAVAWATAIMFPDRLYSLNAVSTPHPLALEGALKSNQSDQKDKSGYITFFRQESVAEQALMENDMAGFKLLYTVSGYDVSDPKLAQTLEHYTELFSDKEVLTAALNWYRAIDFNDISKALSESNFNVTVPTLYVWSSLDIALGKEAAFDTKNYVSADYRFEILEGVSHWIPEMEGEKLSELLLSHIGSTINKSS
jgi:pimeloyl-ACP methyl ester carboxylesterase